MKNLSKLELDTDIKSEELFERKKNMKVKLKGYHGNTMNAKK